MLVDPISVQAGLQQLSRAGSRLLLPQDVGAFWRQIKESPYYAEQIKEIKEEGERLLREPIGELSYSLFKLFEQTGNRLAYEKVYFDRRRRLAAFGLLSMLEPEREAYCEALQDVVWSICSEYSWCLPAHLRGTLETDASLSFSPSTAEWGRKQQRTHIDLFAAETGFALSELLTLAGDAIPPLLRSRMQEEIVHRLFKPYLEHGPYSWEQAEHNWSAVCAGSIGSAALLLLEDEEQVRDIIVKVLGSMDCYLQGFGEDGACQEGLGYWNYGFGYFVYFADLLRKRTQGKLNLFANEKVHQIALFQQKCYLTQDLTVNFSDSLQHARVHIGLTHFLSGVYPDVEAVPASLRASFTEDHCSRFAAALRNLIWMRPQPQQDASSWKSADYYLDNAQWLVSRHVSACGGEFGFAAKGGHNDEPHNHNDVGQFILAGDGQPFAADLGSGEYTAGYFGAERYAYACNSSLGHSLPIIDGRGQEAGRGYAATVRKVELGEQANTLELDIAAAYGIAHLQKLERRFVWHKRERPVLELEDRYTFAAGPESIVERIVTRKEPRLEGHGCILVQGERQLSLRISYDEGAVEPCIRASTYHDHFGVQIPWYAIDFAVRNPAACSQVSLRFEFIDHPA